MKIMKTGAARVLALMLLAFSSAYAEESATVDINYFSNFQSVQGNLGPGGFVEKTSATLESLEIQPTYRSGNALIIDMPAGISPEDLKNISAGFTKTAEIDFLENPTTVLLTWPPGNDEVTDAIFNLAPRGSRPVSQDSPRVRLKKGYILKAPLPGGGHIEAFSDRETIAPGDWFKIILVNSKLNVGAKRLVVKSFAKMFGGSGLLAAMARHGYMDKADVNIGLTWMGPDFHGLPAAATKGLWNETKTDIYAYTPYELPALNSAVERSTGAAAGVPDLIFSNISVSSEALGGYRKKYTVKEVNGVKLGFFFVMDDKTVPSMLGPFPVELTSPGDAAREMVKTLVEKEQVDVVVMLGMFATEDFQALLPKIPGVDIAINSVGGDGYAVVRTNLVKLENWGEESGLPAAAAELPSGRVGKFRLGFSEQDGKKRLVSVLQSSEGLAYADRQRNEYDFYDESGFMVDITSGAHVLPDPSALWDKFKRQYTPLEICNLGAVALNERTKTEIAFIKIRPFSLTTAGAVPEPMLRRWLAHRKIFTGRLDGAAVRQLLKQADFDPVPVAAGEDPGKKFTKENWLSVGGVSEDGRVGGIPLNNNEFYEVSLPDDLLAQIKDFPTLGKLRNKTDTGLYLDDIVVERIQKAKKGPEPEYYEQLRRLIAGTPAPRWRWRLNLKEAALQYSETQVSNTQAFTQVPNPKLQALDQTFLQSSLKLALEARRDTFWNDTKVSLDYGKIILKPTGQDKVVSETADRALFENELRYAAFKWDRLGGAVLGPLVSLGYDTEFTDDTGLPRRKIAVGKAGVKIFEGRVIQDFYTAAVMERDFTYPDVYTKWAWETGTHLGGLLRTRGPEYSVDISYKQFSPSRLRLTDLKREFGLEAKLKIRVFSDLSLAPFVDYYAAKGMTSAKAAHNYIFGISLDYSRLFKLRN